jgi:hypothetical protein
VAHKDFTARHRAEEITFSFEGEKFRCVETLDVDVVLSFARAHFEGNNSAATVQVLPFFNSCLREDDGTEEEPSSFERFQKVLKRKTNRMDLETLGEIMQWLMEQYSERPTQRPADSSVGPSSTGPSLKAVSSSPDTAQEWPVKAGAV